MNFGFREFWFVFFRISPAAAELLEYEDVVVAGSPGRIKSTFKYGDPLKIFVLMYKKILRKEIFHFEASYYPSQHTPHLPSSLS